MTLLFLLALLVTTALLTLFAYVDRLYTEMGKFFLRGVQDNLEVFEKEVEPALKMDRARAGLTFELLTQTMILTQAVLTSYLVFRRESLLWREVAEAMALLVVAMVLFRHLIPHVLITRTAGDWIVPFRPLLRAASLVALPVVAMLSFSFTVADLGAGAGEPKAAPTPAETMEALMDKGEEQGVLEKEDRKLIQSVVEFGDTTVREVMTPRPNIVAVERNATLEELLQAISEKPLSRVPVYDGSLDNIEGVVYTRDLIQLTDAQLRQIRAAERVRPVVLVPETKQVSDLLRELQKQNMHMAIVVDEHGGVAGLATIEDLVEEIVGEIRDESEKPQDVVRESERSYLVSGMVDVDILANLFGVRPDAGVDAATVAGLVIALAGHVPRTGEVIEGHGLRFEVLASSDLAVERLRVTALPPPA